jgi:hypothetical protein
MIKISQRLMISFTKNESEPDWRGYVYAVVLFLTAVVQSLFLHQYFHRCFIIGMRMRTAIIAAVYNKVGIIRGGREGGRSKGGGERERSFPVHKMCSYEGCISIISLIALFLD